MFKPQQLTFEELSRRLRAYEEQYGYSTTEFYRRYQRGELGDDPEMMLWAGLYHLYLTSSRHGNLSSSPPRRPRRRLTPRNSPA
jgi:hypothetical protein